MLTSELNDKLTNVVESLFRLRGLVLIVLYGSVARGEHDRRSDIDVFVLFDSKQSHMENLEALTTALGGVDVRVHVHVSSMEELADEDWTFVDSVLREGIILMAKPPLKIPVEKVLNFKPYTLFRFSTRNLSARDAVRLRRALFSHVERKRVGGQIREYKYDGIIKDEGARLGRDVLIVPNELAKPVREVFKSLNVKFEEIGVYAPQLNIRF
ncbi:MAG: nucleotidyltransferase domain-containing protein [Candidatus Bathyarchaeota archaeon]|nr:nucleotidyltransferase domain-containing protein [Candidatus Bathyarchaeota archaeon]